MCTIKISVLMLFYLLVSEIAGEERHNFSDCQSEPGDRLLTEKSIIRPYKFLGYTSSDMTYSNPDARINCIQVTDQKENGTGGYASIKDRLAKLWMNYKSTGRKNQGRPLKASLDKQRRNKTTYDPATSYCNCGDCGSDNLILYARMLRLPPPMVS
ncbi:hypothetical protein Cfor_03232 [Coptotermes formosanus]|uniref:Uncharacterized protein n=1 Tax=Coptotermes formosanus TaxID=36987 RepID=A0A6L2PEU1_COPFO|nr:hypothetical protein Cfor_03232 [Coptotermes formosanus]